MTKFVILSLQWCHMSIMTSQMTGNLTVYPPDHSDYCQRHHKSHYNGIIMSVVASQITSVSIVCSTVASGADQRKYESSASLAFVQGIHWWLVNSPHKRPVTQKMFPFDDVIIATHYRPIVRRIWIPLEKGSVIGFPSQRASNVESIPMSWQPHVYSFRMLCPRWVPNIATMYAVKSGSAMPLAPRITGFIRGYLSIYGTCCWKKDCQN